MPTIEPHIMQYIDSAIERERIIFNKEVERHIGALIEKNKYDFDMALEALQDRPTESRVREIVHEEIESGKLT